MRYTEFDGKNAYLYRIGPNKALTSQGINKFGQLEDILEKYEIDDLQDLDDRLEKYKFLANHEYSCVEAASYNLLMSDVLEYHNIEDELGIDLVTLFKAIKNGVYEKPYKKNCIGALNFVKPTSEISLIFDDKSPVLCFKNQNGKYDLLILAHYKTYWALTKEELL